MKYEKPRLCDLSGRDVRMGDGQQPFGSKCQSGNAADAQCKTGMGASAGKCMQGHSPSAQCQVGATASYSCRPGSNIRPS